MTFKKFLATTALLLPVCATAVDSSKVIDLVSVNGTKVNNLHLAVFSTQAAGNPKAASPEQQAAMLEELVNIFMLANSKEGKELTKHREIAAALKVANARLIAETLVRKKMQDAKVDEQAIKAAYKTQYVEAPSTEYQARHILLKTEDEAKAIIRELDQGADFAELAKQKSTGPSKTVGGDLGWFTERQMVKPFTDAVAGMQVGNHSQQAVQTQYGWHVILLQDTRQVTVPELDQVRATIVQQLKAQQVGDYIRTVSQASQVKILTKK